MLELIGKDFTQFGTFDAAEAFVFDKEIAFQASTVP